MKYADWLGCGYLDARERIPYKRAPDLPEEVLCLVPEQAPEEARAYWDGWNAGIRDNARNILNGRRGSS